MHDIFWSWDLLRVPGNKNEMVCEYTTGKLLRTRQEWIWNRRNMQEDEGREINPKEVKRITGKRRNAKGNTRNQQSSISSKPWEKMCPPPIRRRPRDKSRVKFRAMHDVIEFTPNRSNESSKTYEIIEQVHTSDLLGRRRRKTTPFLAPLICC